MKTSKVLSSVLWIFLLFLLFSCQTIDNLKKEFYTEPEVLYENQICPSEIQWKSFAPGFWKTDFHINSIGVSWTAVKIDLNNPELHFFVAPQSETLGQLFSVKKFARKTKSIVAINTTPFDLGKTEFPIGITKDQGKIITPTVEKYCALAFIKNETNQWRAQIINHQTPEAIEDYTYAIGGFFTTFENNEFLKFKKNKRSRTGCGISDGGRYLYLMVCTPDFHPTDRNGLNYEECSLIFQKMGCDKAMQFDGGHSSALIIKGKNINPPFLQRKVPVALGFSIK